jgi:hypothetical protein
MSTSFYFKVEGTRDERGDKLGTRSCIAPGQMGFSFQTSEAETRKRVLGPVCRRRKSIVDERGRTYTGLEFVREVLDKCERREPWA